ncbi:MAG: hypothetical protein U5L72_18495 [Bacteroidales bacterium]|nr:hypothetical protein [Bacteroidales bacterium]
MGITEREIETHDSFGLDSYQVSSDGQEQRFSLLIESLLVGALGEPCEQVDIAQVLKEINPFIRIIDIYLRDGQLLRPEVV